MLTYRKTSSTTRAYSNEKWFFGARTWRGARSWRVRVLRTDFIFWQQKVLWVEHLELQKMWSDPLNYKSIEKLEQIEDDEELALNELVVYDE